MSEGILEILDVFELPTGGTVVSGIRGHGWDLVRVGDPIELRSPDGHSTKNSIRGMEVFRKGVLVGPPFPVGLLLAEAVRSDQLPMKQNYKATISAASNHPLEIATSLTFAGSLV